MAKAVEKKTPKAKAPTQKDIFMDAIGTALATAFPDMDVIRVKAPDTPECILIDHEGTHHTVGVTLKKKPVEFEEEDVKRNFSAEVLDNAEAE